MCFDRPMQLIRQQLDLKETEIVLETVFCVILGITHTQFRYQINQSLQTMCGLRTEDGIARLPNDKFLIP